MELRILGPLQVLEGDRALAVGGPRERALLTALALRAGDAVATEALVDAVWGEAPPRSAKKQLQNHVSRLRKVIGAPAIETRDGGYALARDAAEIDARRFEALVHEGRRSAAKGEHARARAQFEEALALWRGAPSSELASWDPARAEVTRLLELRHAAEEEAIDARLASGEHTACVADLEVLVAAEPLREHRWAQLMLALYRGGRQADALRAYQRARAVLTEELGVEPGPELRAVEQSVIAQESAIGPETASPYARPRLPTGVVTFLLTDVEGSARLWDEHPEAMAAAVARHDEIVRDAVELAGGVMMNTRGENDSTFSVFQRATDATAAALAALDELEHESWPENAELLVRFALHAGEAVERDGDFRGPAVNRAERIRSIGVGGQILVSQTVAELTRDHLPEDADLIELRAHALRSLERPERVFALVEPGKPGRNIVDVVCPYPGLRAFEPEDHERFFGREALVELLVQRVTETKFVALVGASGAGKSSLVRAGLVPRMPSDARVLVMKPGEHPLTDPALLALEPASTDRTRLVLVVDQLEELFTLCTDPEERRTFLDAILAAVSEPRSNTEVVVALRADFYGHCADHPGFAALIEASTVLVGPMQPDELREAVEGPAHVSGLRLESGFADVVIADLADEPGALPMLSHALLETWRRRRGHALTIGGYRESGGVRGAIARTADAVYDSFTHEQQAIARDVFVRLTELGEGTDDTRRRVAITELAATSADHSPEHAAEVAVVVELLADARLVTIDESTVEVAHEALIRGWPRLRDWLDEDRDGLRLRGRLSAAADDWAALGRDPGALYRGARLVAVLDWLAGASRALLTAREREFIDASKAAQDAELRTARETSRRLRLQALAFGVAFVIALAAGAFALLQRRDANRQAIRAARNEKRAETARLGTLATTLPARKIDLALLLGIEGRRLLPSLDSDGALEAALVHTAPRLERVVRFDAPSALAAASGDDRLLAAPGTDGNVRLYALGDGRLGRTLEGSNVAGCDALIRAGSVCAPAAAFNADSTLVAGGGFAEVTVWRVATGKPIGPPIVAGGTIVYGLFDPTNKARLYTVSNDGNVTLWDLQDPAHPAPIGDPIQFASGPNDTPAGFISPDGRYLAAGDATVQRTDVWDLPSRTRLYEVTGAPGPFSPDSSTLTTWTAGRVVLRDAATGEERGEPITGLAPIVSGITFSTDGRRLAVGGAGVRPTIRVFDVVSRKLIGAPFRFHRTVAVAATFLSDSRLVTSGADEAAIWNLEAPPAPIETLLKSPGDLAIAQFTPDGTQVITIAGDRRVRAWDAATGASRGDFFSGLITTWYPLAFSPDGKLLAAGGGDGTFTIWDRSSGHQISRTSTGHDGWVAVAWDPRRAIVATDTTPDEPGPATQDSAAALWDVSDPARPRATRTLDPAIRVGVATFSFSPDGRMLALASGTGRTATIFDVGSGRSLHVIHAGVGIAQVAFDPRGGSLAVASSDNGGGTVTFWDTASWTERAKSTVAFVPDGIAFVGGGERYATTNLPSFSTSPTTEVQLWDTETRQPIGEPVPVPTREPFLAFANAKGSRIAVGASDGNATMIDLDPDSWETTACGIAGRNLTHSEWNHYLPGRPYETTCPQWPTP